MVFQHEECEHLGVLSELLTSHNVSYRYVKLYEGESSPSLQGFDGVILLGGPMNVYEEDDYPFLKSENSFVKEALKRRMPTLGICLGAQLIVKAADAKVYRGDRKEIGWFEVSLTAEGVRDRVFRGVGERFTVFQWHGDTFDIPLGGVRLAGSALFPNQAFSIGGFCYALQFHLEVTHRMIQEWVKRYEDELASLTGQVDPDDMLRASAKHIEDLNHRASILCSNFVSLIK